MMQEGNNAGRVAKSGVNAARHDPQGWSTACELIRVGAGEVVFDSRYHQLDLALSRTRALLKAACFMHDYPDEIDSYELMSMVEAARDTLLSMGDDPLEFMEDFAKGARQVVYDQVMRATEFSSVPHVEFPSSQTEFQDVLTQAIKGALEKEGACGSGSKPKRAGKGKAAVKGEA